VADLSFLEILEKREQKFKTSLSTLRVLKSSWSWTEVCGQRTEIRGLGHVAFEKYIFLLGFLILLLSLSHLNSVTLFYTDVINVIFLKKSMHCNVVEL